MGREGKLRQRTFKEIGSVWVEDQSRVEEE